MVSIVSLWLVIAQKKNVILLRFGCAHLRSGASNFGSMFRPLLLDPGVNFRLQFDIPLDLIHRQRRSVERVGLIGQQMPGNGGPVDDDSGTGQNDRIHHQRGHDRIQKLVRWIHQGFFVNFLLLFQLQDAGSEFLYFADQLAATDTCWSGEKIKDSIRFCYLVFLGEYNN